MVTAFYVEFHYQPHTTVTEIFQLIFHRSLCSLSAFEIISDTLLGLLNLRFLESTRILSEKVIIPCELTQ